jgi:Homeodomain-like domain
MMHPDRMRAFLGKRCIVDNPVQRCVERAVVEGPLAALDHRPRPGREPSITLEAKAWLVSLACWKAKDLGYPHELWTTRLLAGHAREYGPAEGHTSLAICAGAQ